MRSGFDYDFRNSSGSLAIFAAIRRASSLVIGVRRKSSPSSSYRFG